MVRNVKSLASSGLGAWIYGEAGTTKKYDYIQTN